MWNGFWLKLASEIITSMLKGNRHEGAAGSVYYALNGIVTPLEAFFSGDFTNC
jgi:hypothetical protein